MRASSDALPTRPLGKTGMHLTRVGFGTWAAGGGGYSFGWDRQDDSDSIAAIRRAVSLGVNWIDTAAVYGLGHSEEIVCRALDGVPSHERPYIFTKCAMVWSESPAEVPRRAASPASIRREVEESLRRLGTDRIDLYQVHWPPQDGTPLEVYWQVLLDLKSEGKVRAVGLSNHAIAEIEAAERLGHVDALQPPLSVIRRDSAAALLPWSVINGVGVIVYSPMESGLLTGAFTRERAAALSADDWRSRARRFTGEDLQRGLAVVNALRPIALRHNTSPGVIAIAWTLAWSGVTGAIVGARNAAQVDGWLRAATLVLSDAELEEIATAIDRIGVGSGPKRPPTAPAGGIELDERC